MPIHTHINLVKHVTNFNMLFTGSSYIVTCILATNGKLVFFFLANQIFDKNNNFIQLEDFQTLNFIIMMAFTNFGVKIIIMY